MVPAPKYTLIPESGKCRERRTGDYFATVVVRCDGEERTGEGAGGTPALAYTWAVQNATQRFVVKECEHLPGKSVRVRIAVPDANGRVFHGEANEGGIPQAIVNALNRQAAAFEVAVAAHTV